MRVHPSTAWTANFNWLHARLIYYWNIQGIQNHVHMHVVYQNAESKRTVVRGGSRWISSYYETIQPSWISRYHWCCRRPMVAPLGGSKCHRNLSAHGPGKRIRKKENVTVQVYCACYSAAYYETRDQKQFAFWEVAADLHELMMLMPQCIMPSRPLPALVNNNWTRGAARRHTTTACIHSLVWTA